MSTSPITAEPTPGQRLRWLVSDSLTMARRNLEHVRQIPEKLLDVTVQPLMFVLLFAYVFGGAIAIDGGSYREYIIAGILVQSLAFGLTGPATSIATDLTEGVIDRFRSLPASRLAYLIGHWAVGLPLGWWLCFHAGWGVAGLWVGLSAGLIIVGVVLVRTWSRRHLGADSPAAI